MEKNMKRGRVSEPIIIRTTEHDENIYIVRAYDNFIRVGANFPRALEILFKFYIAIKIKGDKNAQLLISFLAKAMGIGEKNAVVDSLMKKFKI